MTAEKNTSPRTKPLNNCPVCESEKTKHFFSSPDRLHGVPGEFRYDKCLACNSVFQNPMVIAEDLHLCYPTEYAPYNLTRDVPDVDFNSLPANNFRQKLRRLVVESVYGKEIPGFIGSLGRALSGFRFVRERAFFGLVIDDCLPKNKGEHNALDVGCGSGWFMQKLQKVGWSVDGLEWNENVAEFAREVTRSKVYTGDFLAADLPKGKYQLIVLNHVFEHFAEPKLVIERLRELLSDDGKAVLFYPNPNSVGAWWFGSRWFPWEVPRHLILPSLKAIRMLAGDAGFSGFTGNARFYYSEVHWARSKAYVVGRHPENDPPKLTPSEMFGLNAERILSALGWNNGWEIVAVLEK